MGMCGFDVAVLPLQSGSKDWLRGTSWRPSMPCVHPLEYSAMRWGNHVGLKGLKRILLHPRLGLHDCMSFTRLSAAPGACQLSCRSRITYSRSPRRELLFDLHSHAQK